jgi:hypothetical protein
MRAVTRAPETVALFSFCETRTCSVARFPASQVFAFNNSRLKESRATLADGTAFASRSEEGFVGDVGVACCANFKVPDRNSSKIA